MLSYLLRRALTLLLVLFGLSILIFIIARIVPGDPAGALGPLATATQVEELREEMSLNASFPVQLWSYLPD